MINCTLFKNRCTEHIKCHDWREHHSLNAFRSIRSPSVIWLERLFFLSTPSLLWSQTSQEVMVSFVRLRRCSQVPRNYFIYYVCLSSCNHIMEADSYLHSTPMKWNQGSSYSLTYSQFASFILLDLMSFPLGHSYKRVFIDYFELANWIRTNNNKTRHPNQNSFCNTI